MSPRVRLSLIGLSLISSAFYTSLMAFDLDAAKVVALAYIALLLTIFTTVEIWKKP